MTGRERFPVYVDLQDRLGRWPGGRTFKEQKALVGGLVTHLFETWDAKELAEITLTRERDPNRPGSLANQLREATRERAAA